MSLDPATLAGSASVAGIVAGFYYTTQRAEVAALLEAPVPFADDRIRALRGGLVKRIRLIGLIAFLHLPLSVVFVAGAASVLADLDLDAPVNTTRVAVVVVAGLALLHMWVIVTDLLSLVRRVRSLPSAAPVDRR